MDNTSELKDMKVAMSETNISDLDLDDKKYSAVSVILEDLGLLLMYECRVRALTTSQKGLYEKVLSKIPKEIALFVDSIVVSFALKDACDISGVDYVWLDLEGGDDVGCSAWVKEKDENAVINLSVNLLKRHIEKYLIDAYDRGTREDLAKVWEAGLGLQECPICGNASVDRRTISSNNRKFRGWTCSVCTHHVIVPSDALDYLSHKIEGSA